MDSSIFLRKVLLFFRSDLRCRCGLHLGIGIRNLITLSSITVDFLCGNAIQFFHLCIGAHQSFPEWKRIGVPGTDIGEKFSV